jgi:hypothetical protein
MRGERLSTGTSLLAVTTNSVRLHHPPPSAAEARLHPKEIYIYIKTVLIQVKTNAIQEYFELSQRLPYSSNISVAHKSVLRSPEIL